MTRNIVVLTVALLTACSALQKGQELANRPPSISVAEAALASGAPQVALVICTDWTAREPSNLDAQICEGNALAALGRRDEAEAKFLQAQQISSSETRGLMGMGRLKLSTDPQAAEALFKQVLDRNPNNAAAWNDLGIASDLQERHAEAQVAYQRALGSAPGMHAAEVNLALSMAMSGHAEEAVQRLRALASNPDASPRLRHDFAAALAMANQPEEAAKLLRRELRPDEIDQAIAGYRALADATPPSAAPVAMPTATPQATNPVPLATSPSPRPVDVAVPRPVVEAPPAPTQAAVLPTHQAEQPAQPAPRMETAAPPTPPVAEPPVSLSAGGGPVEVRIVLRATADSWVRVSERHGRALLNRLMHSGDFWSVPPDAQPAQLRLTTGNAGGIDIIIDGQPVPSLGKSGTVRHEVPLDPVALREGQPAVVVPHGRRRRSPVRARRIGALQGGGELAYSR
jgi:Flp pilus assembly protein TadD